MKKERKKENRVECPVLPILADLHKLCPSWEEILNCPLSQPSCRSFTCMSNSLCFVYLQSGTWIVPHSEGTDGLLQVPTGYAAMLPAPSQNSFPLPHSSDPPVAAPKPIWGAEDDSTARDSSKQCKLVTMLSRAGVERGGQTRPRTPGGKEQAAKSLSQGSREVAGVGAMDKLRVGLESRLHCSMYPRASLKMQAQKLIIMNFKAATQSIKPQVWDPPKCRMQLALAAICT